MIIWSGWGLLIILIYFVVNFIVSFLTVGMKSNEWTIALTFFISGVICWFLGKRLNKSSDKVYIDKETGTEVTLKKARHRLFFINMEYWGPILIILGLVSLLIK